MPRRALRVIASICIATSAMQSVAESAHAASPVVGALNSIVVNADRTVSVSGWAWTSDAPWAAIGVILRIDGVDYFPAANYRLADLPSSNPYSGYGNHGFAFTAPAPSGWHWFCVLGQNAGVYNQVGSCSAQFVPTPAATNTGFSDAARYSGAAWPQSPHTTLALTYGRSNGGTLPLSEVQAAMNGWMAVAPRLSLSYSGLGTGVGNIMVNSGNYNSYWGWNQNTLGVTISQACYPNGVLTTGPPLYGGCAFPASQSVGVYVNTGAVYMSYYETRVATVAHEVGHALGLWHPPNPGVTTVMASGPPASVVTLPFNSFVPNLPSSFDGTSFAMAYT